MSLQNLGTESSQTNASRINCDELYLTSVNNLLVATYVNGVSIDISSVSRGTIRIQFPLGIAAGQTPAIIFQFKRVTADSLLFMQIGGAFGGLMKLRLTAYPGGTNLANYTITNDTAASMPVNGVLNFQFVVL